mmetsp:Transcript_8570/g.34889  ORF Transcript_8570/g.34889 Transcript_8570/m.34889 type:complete len:218 (+) Transcript_8570:1029-1682(+)
MPAHHGGSHLLELVQPGAPPHDGGGRSQNLCRCSGGHSRSRCWRGGGGDAPRVLACGAQGAHEFDQREHTGVPLHARVQGRGGAGWGAAVLLAHWCRQHRRGRARRGRRRGGAGFACQPYRARSRELQCAGWLWRIRGRQGKERQRGAVPRGRLRGLALCAAAQNSRRRERPEGPGRAPTPRRGGARRHLRRGARGHCRRVHHQAQLAPSLRSGERA